MSTSLSSATRTFNQRRATEAALLNEQITRERVDALERHAKASGTAVAALLEVSNRGFLGRLRWLLTGK